LAIEATDKVIVIALDAMGGDRAPDAVLGGANAFAKKHSDVNFLLFGDENILNDKLSHYTQLQNQSQVCHAPDVVDDAEKPSAALRKGRHSSMRLAIDAVRSKRAHAVLSGGNTGALMAMAKLGLSTIPGIDRPAICSVFPTMKKSCVLLDLGANVDCNVDNLVQFCIMGDAFAKVILGRETPRVRLLNIGSEDTKGSEIVKAAAQEIRDGGYDINFCGYIEGNEIAQGIADVIVTDGFTGNVALKTAEGTANMCGHYIKQAFKSSPLAFLGGMFAKRAIKKMFKRMDPRYHNGALFVGLNGIAVKSHGYMDEIGLQNAIKVTYNLAKYDINKKISSELMHDDESGSGNEDILLDTTG